MRFKSIPEDFSGVSGGFKKTQGFHVFLKKFYQCFRGYQGVSGMLQNFSGRFRGVSRVFMPEMFFQGI